MALRLAPGTGRNLWYLTGNDGKQHIIDHHPRLVTDDLATLKRAALMGLGIVVLPRFFCARDIARGDLALALPEWEPAPGNVHAVYPSRRGQPAAVRGFVDFVAPRMEKTLKRMQAG
jgi:DNA-binding transcriptional LysR family regulator